MHGQQGEDKKLLLCLIYRIGLDRRSADELATMRKGEKRQHQRKRYMLQPSMLLKPTCMLHEKCISPMTPCYSQKSSSLTPPKWRAAP